MLLKASSEIADKEKGMTISFSEQHFVKAPLSIVVTDDGIDICFNELQ